MRPVRQRRVEAIAVDLEGDPSELVHGVDAGDPLAVPLVDLTIERRLPVLGDQRVEPSLEVARGRDVALAADVEELGHRLEAGAAAASELASHRQQLRPGREPPGPGVVERLFELPGMDRPGDIEQRARRRRDRHPVEDRDVVRRQPAGRVHHRDEIVAA